MSQLFTKKCLGLLLTLFVSGCAQQELTNQPQKPVLANLDLLTDRFVSDNPASVSASSFSPGAPQLEIRKREVRAHDPSNQLGWVESEQYGVVQRTSLDIVTACEGAVTVTVVDEARQVNSAIEASCGDVVRATLNGPVTITAANNHGSTNVELGDLGLAHSEITGVWQEVPNLDGVAAVVEADCESGVLRSPYPGTAGLASVIWLADGTEKTILCSYSLDAVEVISHELGHAWEKQNLPHEETYWALGTKDDGTSIFGELLAACVTKYIYGELVNFLEAEFEGRIPEGACGPDGFMFELALKASADICGDGPLGQCESVRELASKLTFTENQDVCELAASTIVSAPPELRPVAIVCPTR